MMALGWIWSGVRLPDGVQVFDQGPVSVVAVAQHVSATPRDRMLQQLRIFERGPDLLPIAGHIALTVEEALDHPVNTIETALKAITGTAQFTVMMRQDPTQAPPPPANGRDWLRDRQTRYAAHETAAVQLETLAAAVGDQHTAPRRSPGGIVSDVLIQRADAHKTRPRVRAAAKAFLPDTAQVTVIGPWPPYSFSHLAEETRA